MSCLVSAAAWIREIIRLPSIYAFVDPISPRGRLIRSAFPPSIISLKFTELVSLVTILLRTGFLKN